MEIIAKDFVFQVDATIVKEAYENDNFLVQYNDEYKYENRCAVYFSSNDIYYPNSEDVFRNRILEKDSYEWYGTRINGVYKHVFVRDIKKQWYLEGINAQINSPELLHAFLQEETRGYSVTMIGSSAGGYAAVLYGSLLSVKKVLSFNGQFELNSLLKTSNRMVDPILFKNAQTSISKYFDLGSFVNDSVDIFYFSSLGSKWDYQQYCHIKSKESVKPLLFKTSHHGVPFVKAALPLVINMNSATLEKLIGRVNNPILFSIKRLGVIKTITSIYRQLVDKRKRRKV